MNLIEIINQLRRERDLIDRAIAAMEALREGHAVAPGQDDASVPPSSKPPSGRRD